MNKITLLLTTLIWGVLQIHAQIIDTTGVEWQ
jgi:hypothetical protein